MHTCNLECGHLYRMCMGIISQNLELCDQFYKLMSLNQIYMLIWMYSFFILFGERD